MNVSKIRRILQQRGMTITELARLANADRSHISNILAGRRKPSIDLALKLSRVLGITVNELMMKGGKRMKW